MKHLGSYGYTHAKDVLSENSFCIEHSQNTWCNNTNTEFIRNKAGLIRVNSRDLSQNWAEITTKMLCSLCDGGISTGLIRGLCPSQWQNWYSACKENLFTADTRSNELGAGKITFCNKKSLLCSELGDIYEDSTKFCTQMGLDVSEEEDQWYDGVPWSNKMGKAKLLKRSKNKSRRPKSKKDESFFDSIIGKYHYFSYRYPRILLIIYSWALLFLPVIIVYSIYRNIFSNGGKYQFIDQELKEKRRRILEKRSNKGIEN